MAIFPRNIGFQNDGRSYSIVKAKLSEKRGERER
jgi:hypothetical protein